MGSKSAKNGHLVQNKNLQLANLASICNLVKKIKKLSLFWPKKGIFRHVTEPVPGTPTSQESCIRDLKNALIDLEIDMHIP